jgi:hypothetical protein
VSDWQMGPPLGEGNGQNDRDASERGGQGSEQMWLVRRVRCEDISSPSERRSTFF